MTKLEFIDKQLDRLTLTNVVAVILMVAFIGFGVLVFTHRAPEGVDHNNITLVLMAFSSAVSGVTGWLYGSSQTSAKKTDALLKAMPGTTSSISETATNNEEKTK